MTRQVFLSSTQILNSDPNGAYWTANNHTWTENSEIKAVNLLKTELRATTILTWFRYSKKVIRQSRITRTLFRITEVGTLIWMFIPIESAKWSISSLSISQTVRMVGLIRIPGMSTAITYMILAVEREFTTRRKMKWSYKAIVLFKETRHFSINIPTMMTPPLLMLIPAKDGERGVWGLQTQDMYLFSARIFLFSMKAKANL